MLDSEEDDDIILVAPTPHNTPSSPILLPLNSQEKIEIESNDKKLI